MTSRKFEDVLQPQREKCQYKNELKILHYYNLGAGILNFIFLLVYKHKWDMIKPQIIFPSTIVLQSFFKFFFLSLSLSVHSFDGLAFSWLHSNHFSFRCLSFSPSFFNSRTHTHTHTHSLSLLVPSFDRKNELIVSYIFAWNFLSFFSFLYNFF